VSDDGRGFDMESAWRGNSFGLVGMRERVLMLGGTLEIDSQPGDGCTLRAGSAGGAGDAGAKRLRHSQKCRA
jgi:nitrate/nitrite-specific signal transduction histidine kinase